MILIPNEAIERRGGSPSLLDR